MKKSFQLLIILNFLFTCLEAQELYNLKNTEEFADYLFFTKQYKFASEEYERVIFLAPNHEKAKANLFISYRFSENYERGIFKFNELYKENLYQVSAKISEEYTKLLLLNTSNEGAYDFLEKNKSLDKNLKTKYQLSSLLLQKNWEKANLFLKENEVNEESLVILTEKANNIKYKNPYLALGLSTIIPGLGKVYANRWQDGLISFIFIGANTWQSYRGFKKYGSESWYGYLCGGLSVGFYFGNIYGSFKEAKNYNNNKNNEIYHESKNIIFNNF